MSIDEPSVIDFVSVDDLGNVHLTISDHLDWAATKKHLMLLQEKINMYCRYVETGQLYDEYPQTRDRRPTIEVVFFHTPVADAELFLHKVKSTLEQEGFLFSWSLYQSQAKKTPT
jgi:allantoicase